MARRDYFNDPNAPKANSILPSVTVIVTNEAGELLLVHKTDNDLWALPGGGMDIDVTGIVGLYTNPRHVMAYDDGEVRQQCSACFTSRLLGGQLTTSSETKEVRFVPPAQLETLRIHPSMRMRIDHWAQHRDRPYIG